jgi:hypothetical protein
MAAAIIDKIDNDAKKDNFFISRLPSEYDFFRRPGCLAEAYSVMTDRDPLAFRPILADGLAFQITGREYHKVVAAP